MSLIRLLSLVLATIGFLEGVAAVAGKPAPNLIIVETDAGFCMGECDSFRLTVADNGKAHLKVYHNRDLVRAKTIRLSPAQLDAFRNRLAPFRPIGDRFLADPKQCDSFATDLGGYHVTWRDDGPPARLMLNDGCGGKRFDAMRSALGGAAESLGFKNLPTTSGGVMASTVIKSSGADH